jgi:hypothetical protein
LPNQFCIFVWFGELIFVQISSAYKNVRKLFVIKSRSRKLTPCLHRWHPWPSCRSRTPGSWSWGGCRKIRPTSCPRPPPRPRRLLLLWPQPQPRLPSCPRAAPCFPRPPLCPPWTFRRPPCPPCPPRPCFRPRQPPCPCPPSSLCPLCPLSCLRPPSRIVFWISFGLSRSENNLNLEKWFKCFFVS